jgi:hypothetical protein
MGPHLCRSLCPRLRDHRVNGGTVTVECHGSQLGSYSKQSSPSIAAILSTREAGAAVSREPPELGA